MIGLSPKVYKHYKGGSYVLVGVASDSNNDRHGEATIVYMSITPPHVGELRVRHFREFIELVEWPNGDIRPRYILENEE